MGAMDDALLTRCVQPVGNLDRNRQDGFEFDGSGRNEMPHGDAVEELHSDERLIAMIAGSVDAAESIARQKQRLPPLPTGHVTS